MAADGNGDDGGRRRPRPRHDGFCEERKQLFLVALRNRETVLTACRLVGISNRTAYNHRDRDADFARAWDLARKMTALPLELVAFQRGVMGIEEPVYAYGKLSHKRVRLSDAALFRLLAADQPEKYGRGAGFADQRKWVKKEIRKRLAAEIGALRDALRLAPGGTEKATPEIVHFVNPRSAPKSSTEAGAAEEKAGRGKRKGPPNGPEISPFRVQP